MEIKLTELKSLIAEAVSKKLQEAGVFGVDWEKMRLLHRSNKLTGRWNVIMTAMEETGSPEKTLALLKSAVATLELHKSRNPEPEVPQTPESDDFDFSP